MPLYQSIYAGGYDKEKKAKLEATKLPEKIKCQSCNKLKVPDSFSNNQLLDFKQRLARNPRLALPTSAIITCRQCQPNQVHELECSQCGQMKSLDGFTKAQRRDPDRAVSVFKSSRVATQWFAWLTFSSAVLTVSTTISKHARLEALTPNTYMGTHLRCLSCFSQYLIGASRYGEDVSCLQDMF